MHSLKMILLRRFTRSLLSAIHILSLKLVSFVVHSVDSTMPLKLGLLSLVEPLPNWDSPPNHITLSCSSITMRLILFFFYFMWMTWLLVIMLSMVFTCFGPSLISSLKWRTATSFGNFLGLKDSPSPKGFFLSKAKYGFNLILKLP